jgi:hypothetical protein
VGRGAAAADFDNDGDTDLLVQDNGGAPALLRNGVVQGRWLGLLLRGVGENPEAVGAVTTLESGGGRRQVRWVTAGDSYQSTSDRRQLFGIPGRDEPRQLEVRWPTGAVLRILRPPIDRYLVLPAPPGAAEP